MKKLLVLILTVLMILGCKQDEPDPIVECVSGCVGISEIETKHDYYLPFSIVNNIDSISKITLNNSPADIPAGSSYALTEYGFYELIVEYNNDAKESDTILFTIKSEERQYAEWGINVWVPALFETSFMGNEDIEAIYPRFYSDKIKVPFIFYTKIAGNRTPLYLKANYNNSGAGFFIKQGEGSINVSASNLTSTPEFNIGGKSVHYNITRKELPDLVLSGNISEDLEIEANSYIKITGNLNIIDGATLTFNEGTLILIDEAVDINHSGPIYFRGVENNPVFITCSDENKFWGGFLTTSSEAIIEASHTIFCQSGYHNTNEYNWGHAGRQALFYTLNSSLTLDHCYMLDHIGQIFYPQNAVLKFNDILVQRVKTGGQLNTSDITINNSIFTDFPDDTRIYSDNDNDGLYINASNAIIDNSLFMYAKDDGMDAGLDDGGNIQLKNCRFEACFHEGAALSSRNTVVKNQNFINCIFTNCGQGIELGFSSPNHTVIVDDCIFYKNGVGIRYGDNYDWSYIDGKMHVKNTLCIENDKDVWNMVRMDWKPKLENMTFENTFLTTPSVQYPDLKILEN